MDAAAFKQAAKNNNVLLETMLEWNLSTAMSGNWELRGTSAEPRKFEFEPEIVIKLTSIRASKLPLENGRMEFRFHVPRRGYLGWNAPNWSALNLKHELKDLQNCRFRQFPHGKFLLLEAEILDSKKMDYLEFGDRAVQLVNKFLSLFIWYEFRRRSEQPRLPAPNFMLVPSVRIQTHETRKPQYLPLGKFVCGNGGGMNEQT